MVSTATAIDNSKGNPNDVLCGRGKCVNNYSGNKRLRTIAKEYQQEYKASETIKEKKDIVLQILARINYNGGRFLQSNNDSTWSKLSAPKTERKIRQILQSKSKLSQSVRVSPTPAPSIGRFGGRTAVTPPPPATSPFESFTSLQCHNAENELRFLMRQNNSRRQRPAGPTASSSSSSSNQFSSVPWTACEHGILVEGMAKSGIGYGYRKKLTSLLLPTRSVSAVDFYISRHKTTLVRESRQCSSQKTVTNTDNDNNTSTISFSQKYTPNFSGNSQDDGRTAITADSDTNLVLRRYHDRVVAPSIGRGNDPHPEAYSSSSSTTNLGFEGTPDVGLSNNNNNEPLLWGQQQQQSHPVLSVQDLCIDETIITALPNSVVSNLTASDNYFKLQPVSVRDLIMDETNNRPSNSHSLPESVLSNFVHSYSYFESNPISVQHLSTHELSPDSVFSNLQDPNH